MNCSLREIMTGNDTSYHISPSILAVLYSLYSDTIYRYIVALILYHIML